MTKKEAIKNKGRDLVMLKRIVVGLTMLMVVLSLGCTGVGGRSATGAIAITILFPAQRQHRVIPPETQRVRVEVAGEGLTQPLVKVVERPSSETSEVKVTFTNVPVGNKTVTAIAEDQYGTHRARGSQETTVISGQTATVTIELGLTNLASVIGRLVNIRTGEGAGGVTVRIGNQQATSGSDGRFAVTNVEAGTQTITFSSDTYRGYSKSISVTVPLTDIGEVLLLPQQLMNPPDQPSF